jgi:hypothetical protein
MPLTRNIGIQFPEVQDEIVAAFADIIPADIGENFDAQEAHLVEITCIVPDWTKVPALSTIVKIVCRTSNRLFVGLPLCMYHSWFGNSMFILKLS